MSSQLILEQEQKELLTILVESSRNLSRDKRQNFLVLPAGFGEINNQISHPGLPNNFSAYYPDIDILFRSGLLVPSKDGDIISFYVSPIGYAYYEQIRKQNERPVLEVGCGTGYFTVPLARLIGERGCLVAIDVVPQSVELVSRKLQTARLNDVRVIKADAMETDFEAGSFDVALLFGVIPAPMMPLNRLLPEMHRVLKADSSMAVWPPIPGYLPQSIIRSGLFTFSGKRNGVHRFRRYQETGRRIE